MARAGMAASGHAVDGGSAEEDLGSPDTLPGDGAYSAATFRAASSGLR